MKTKKQAQQEIAERAQVKADEVLALLTRTTVDLQHKEFDPMRWVVPDVLPEGLSMLAGRPKIGKSWLALDVATAVAGGGVVLGKKVERGDVLLLALEDTDRRIQRRMTKMLGAQKKDWPNVTYATEWHKLSEGGIDHLRAWAKKAVNPRLMIIDVLERVRERGSAAQNQYASDYEALKSLHQLAAEFQMSVLVLHHQRKAGADDLMDTLSGTLGLGGALDSALVLGRGDDGHFLWGRGRDLEEFTIAVKLDDHCRWQSLGPRAEGHASEERERVFAVMRKHVGAMRLDEIAKALGRPKDSIKMLISRMHKDAELQSVGRGLYQLMPDQVALPLVGESGQEVI